MGKGKVEKYICGSVRTNCYFFINTETREVILVDPADNAPLLKKKIEEKGLKPVAILLTHGHFDHIMAADELRNAYDIPVIAQKEEQMILENPRGNLSVMMGANYSLKADQYVEDNTVLELAGFSIQVMHTPGHTIGGCCYYVKDENLVFSGDTLFCESVGRSDFPTGSMSTLIRSIKNRLLVLPDETKVYPGHESTTDIENEKMNNPFL